MTHSKNRSSVALLLLCITWSACTAQENRTDVPGTELRSVGGPFENREFTYYGIPKVISATDTSPGYAQEGEKLLITGKVFQPDGRTPAPGVLLYYYHTNTEGRYPTDASQPRNMPPNELGQTHGFMRGWVRTNSSGRYAIHTVRPGTYPTRDEPAHIHATIKEPNEINEYYIDDFLFDDDPLLTAKRRLKFEARCGSGVLRLVNTGDVVIGERDIVLGLNIPDHPRRSSSP